MPFRDLRCLCRIRWADAEVTCRSGVSNASSGQLDKGAGGSLLRGFRLVEIQCSRCSVLLPSLNLLLASDTVSCPGNALEPLNGNWPVTSDAVAIAIVVYGAKGTLDIGQCR